MNEQILMMLGQIAGPQLAETVIKGAVAYYKANPDKAREMRDFIIGSLEQVTQATATEVDDLLVWAFRELMAIPSAAEGEAGGASRDNA